MLQRWFHAKGLFKRVQMLNPTWVALPRSGTWIELLPAFGR